MVVVVDTGKSAKFEHSPIDITLTTDVKSGARADEYPSSKAVFETPVSNADENPSTSEYRLKGPVSAPAVVNVINTVISYFILYSTTK